MTEYSKEIIDKLNSIAKKRPRLVVQHILKNGFVTTEDLETKYGYRHAPRAARDVRELGIPLVTFRVKSLDGKTIGAYKFGDLTKMGVVSSKALGRTALSKALKKALIDKYGSKCFVYLQPLEKAELQVDHRIPYEIGGEESHDDIDQYMLLSRSANRAKSWTCEHCSNWKRKDKAFCMSCFWAHPESYTHVADRQERIIVVTFTGDEIEDYDKLISLVGQAKAADTIKEVIKKYIL